MNKLLVALCAAFVSPGPACAAEAPAWYGASDCRIAPVGPPPVQDVHWSGQCKDGYAEGGGVLEWRASDKLTRRLEATLVRGQVEGEATLTWDNGNSYIGTFANGVPHGQGYLRSAYRRYEGGIVNGKPEGNGIGVYPGGGRYEGQWKDGQPHGIGRATFVLGGSYEGEWKRGERDGKGVLVYAGSGRRYEGQFTQDRVAGTPPPPSVPDKLYSLKVYAPIASALAPDAASGGVVPMNLGYAQLTPEQKRLVNSQFPALEEGDEPPYPLHGLRKFYAAIARAGGKFNAVGEVRVYVTVGADGRAVSASSVGLDDEKMRYFAAAAAMAQEYKPAVCRGKPCQMVYGFRLMLAPAPL